MLQKDCKMRRISISFLVLIKATNWRQLLRVCTKKEIRIVGGTVVQIDGAAARKPR